MPDVSGTVFTDAGTTPMGAGRTLNISINGAASAGNTTTAANGTYTIAGLTINSGDVVAVYIQDGVNPEKAVTVTIGTGSNLTGIDLYQNYLSVRSDGGTMTKTALDTSDANAATGLSGVYSAGASTLSTSSTNSCGFCIQSGQAFAPTASYTMTVNGEKWICRGTFTPSISTTVLLSRATTGCVSGGQAFHNLTIGGAGTPTVVLEDAVVVNGTLALGSGALDVSASNFGVTANGNFTTTSGTFTARNGTVTFSGSATQTIAGSNTFYDLVRTTAAARTLRFTDGTTTTVTNSVTFTGSPGALLTLSGTSTGGWTIAMPATQTLGYLSVSRSTATGNTAAAGATSTNGGNNTNWTFGASGTGFGGRVGGGGAGRFRGRVGRRR